MSSDNLRNNTIAGRRHDGASGFADIPHYLHSDAAAAISRRQCTTQHKIRPIKAQARRIARNPGVQQYALAMPGYWTPDAVFADSMLHLKEM